MCKCTPNIRTPYCGRGECVHPDSKPKEARASEAHLQDSAEMEMSFEEAIRAIDDLFWLAHGSITSGDYSRFRNAIAVVARAARPTRQRDVEEWLDDDWCRPHECGIAEHVIDVDSIRRFLASWMAGHVRVPVHALREVIRISDRDHEAWNIVKTALNASKGE